MDNVSAFETFRDERGLLLPIRLQEVPFTVRRIFTVSESFDQAVRGDHVVSGQELLILISGTMTVENGPSIDTGTPTTLTVSGQSILLSQGDYLRYWLHDESTVVLVLADQEYGGRTPGEDR